MATIAENLNKLQNIKSDIKTALRNKGVEVTDDFSTYANAIDSITTGGGSSGGGGNVETISLSGGFGFPLVIEEMLAEKRYYLHVDGDIDGNEQTIIIEGFEGPNAEEKVTIKHFYAVIQCVPMVESPFDVSLLLPDVNIRWANEALPSIVGDYDTFYELSITQVNDYGLVYYNAVLTPFKPVE